MKASRLSILIISLSFMLMFAGCGSDGGSGSDSGVLSMDIADSKPMLPVEDVEQFFVTFTEVLAHKSGGGWMSLPLAVEPEYTIDLLQFYGGNATELVPPVELETGKYTQIRLVVSKAEIVIDGDPYPVDISSNDLKTDKNFDFLVEGGGAADITIDFDLSKSIVVTGLNEYKLKPVLHIVDTFEAARITGSITDQTFFDNDSVPATITVYLDQEPIGTIDSGDEVYTKVEVPEHETETETAFSIFWLVPHNNYIIEIDMDKEQVDPNLKDVFTIAVAAATLGKGATVDIGTF